MKNLDALVGNPGHDNSRYCFAKPNEIYVVYSPDGGETTIDLREAEGAYTVDWFNPRSGGELIEARDRDVAGGVKAAIGPPPQDPQQDWLILLRRK